MWARVGVTDVGHSVDTCVGHWCGSQCGHVLGVTDVGHSVDTCWGHWCGSQCGHVLGSLMWVTV